MVDSCLQGWQWIHKSAKLDDGRTITQDLYEDLRDDEIEEIRHTVGSAAYQTGHYVQAICIFNKLVVQDKWEEFLTLSAYDHIISNDNKRFVTTIMEMENELSNVVIIDIEKEKAG